MPKAPKAVVGKAKIVHPNSRQAMCIQKQLNRDQRLMKNKAETVLKQEQLQQKLLWYQSNLDPQKSMYSKHDVAELTSKYLLRFEDELEQIGIVNAVGNRQTKQHQARETAIKITKERENQGFDTVGIEVPDLINGKNLDGFRNWTGETKYLQNIKFRKSKRTDLKTSASFNDGKVENDEKNTEDLPDYDDSVANVANENLTASDELPDFIDADTS